MITCIVCPKGCKLCVTNENGKYIVTGNGCSRGIKYGIDEVTNPKRTITSTVKVIGGICTRLPVITDKEIPKELIFDVMREIKKVRVNAPIHYKQIIIKNVLNSGVNLISTRTLNKDR